MARRRRRVPLSAHDWLCACALAEGVPAVPVAARRLHPRHELRFLRQAARDVQLRPQDQGVGGARRRVAARPRVERAPGERVEGGVGSPRVRPDPRELLLRPHRFDLGGPGHIRRQQRRRGQRSGRVDFRRCFLRLERREWVGGWSPRLGAGEGRLAQPGAAHGRARVGA